MVLRGQLADLVVQLDPELYVYKLLPHNDKDGREHPVCQDAEGGVWIVESHDAVLFEACQRSNRFLIWI